METSRSETIGRLGSTSVSEKRMCRFKGHNHARLDTYKEFTQPHGPLGSGCRQHRPGCQRRLHNGWQHSSQLAHAAFLTMTALTPKIFYHQTLPRNPSILHSRPMAEDYPQVHIPSILLFMVHIVGNSGSFHEKGWPRASSVFRPLVFLIHRRCT